MPLAAFFFRRRPLDLLLFIVLTTLSLIWLYVALHSTVDLRIERAYTTSYIISYYVKNPLAFFTVIWSTLMNAEVRQFYQMSFIGILGWLDLTLEGRFYNFAILVCAWMGILSIQWKRIKADWPVRVWLLSFFVTSILLIFFMLLVTWTNHPAVIVSGVQGRYFLVSFILLAYSLSGWTEPISPGRKLAALLPYYLYCLVLGLVMPQALVYRYFAQ
jgi:uncharacterized membrane protein